MSVLAQNMRYGIRLLLKKPGFTAMAVLTLAIGIGANIALFSVIHAVLLKPLPFDQPDQLLVLSQKFNDTGRTTLFSYPDYLDWRASNPVFDELSAYTPAEFDWIGEQGATRIDGASVTASFFAVLDVSAHLGRPILERDEQPGAEHVVVLSYGCWKRRFGGDPDILGRQVQLHKSLLYTVVGVLPDGFQYPHELSDAEAWTALRPQGDMRTHRGMCAYRVLGRLQDGMTLATAKQLINLFEDNLTESHHGAGARNDVEVLISTLSDTVVGRVRPTLWLLAGVVGFILLIACANVANLCLSRAASRNKEMAIRQALGAGGGRLLGQFLTESLVLSMIGGAVGLLLAWWSCSLLKVVIADLVPRTHGIQVDLGSLLFGVGVSLLVGLVLGIAPFWFFMKARAAESLGERHNTSLGHRRFSNAIVTAQIALALILSIGAGLMIRSLGQLSAVDPGFDPDNLLTFSVTKSGNESQRWQFSQDLLGRIRSLPNVVSASSDSSMLSSPYANSGPVTVPGRPNPMNRDQVVTVFHNVSPDYFRTLGIPILRGRDMALDEHEKSEVVLINEGLARLFWSDEDPIGRDILFCGKNYRVIGIVNDMVQGSVKNIHIPAEKSNHIFLPFRSVLPNAHMQFVVRTQAESLAVVSDIRAILKDIDPTMPLYGAGTFKAKMNGTIHQERFTTTFLTLFTGIAMILIIVGIYGVVSYSAAQRTNEIGIRMALGAGQHSIRAMILRHGLILSAVGTAIGLAGAMGLTRFLQGYLFEVSATDPLTFVVIPPAIVLVTLLACYVPARRAARTDPMVALRYE